MYFFVIALVVVALLLGFAAWVDWTRKRSGTSGDPQFRARPDSFYDRYQPGGHGGGGLGGDGGGS